MYDYREAMKEDIRNYINDNYDAEELTEAMEDRGSFFEHLSDDLWTVDSVTGNGSGSYTFCTATAKEYVLDNMDLVKEAYGEFGYDNAEVGKAFVNEEWEAMDVTIRCYLINECLSEVLDEIENELA